MKRHSSDRHIQGQLEHHQTPVNAEELWAAIEPAVQPEKRSRWWLLLWFFFGVAGITLFGYFVHQNYNSTFSAEHTTVAKSTIDQSSLSPTHSATTQQDKSSPTVAPSISDSALLRTNATITSKTENNITPNNAVNNTKNNQYNISSKKSSVTLSSTQKVSSSLKSKTENNILAPIKIPPSNPLSPYLSVDTKKQTPIIVNEAVAATTINTKEVASRQVLSLFDPLKTLDYSFLENPLPTIDAPQKSFNFVPSSRNGFTPWSLNFRVGIGSTLQDLSTKTDSFLSYQAMRNKSEKQLENLSLEIGLQWTSRQNWYLRSGLGYRQTVERFSFSTSSTETFTENEGIIKITITPDGNRDTMYGPVTGIRTIMFEKTTYNRHRFLEVPIIAGYNFGEGPFSFGVEVGVVPQFLFQVKGEILDTRSSFIDLESVSETKLAWSLHSAFNINYTLDEAWQVQLSPVFRYQFSNLHQADYPLEVSYHSLGAQLGIRYAW